MRSAGFEPTIPSTSSSNMGINHPLSSYRLCIEVYFMSNNMLTTEEIKYKDEIIDLTEQVLDARGLECDDRISKLSEEKLEKYLKK
jgi:hypothetical protein